MVAPETHEHDVDVQKREFMKRFGKYAASAPLGMYLLMGPGASKAQASGSTAGCGCSCGGSMTGSFQFNNSPFGYQVDKIDGKVVVRTNYENYFSNGFYYRVEIENGVKTTYYMDTNIQMPTASWLDTLTDDLLTFLGC